MPARVLTQPFILEILWSRSKQCFSVRVMVGTLGDKVHVTKLTGYVRMSTLHVYTVKRGSGPAKLLDVPNNQFRIFRQGQTVILDLHVYHRDSPIDLRQSLPAGDFMEMCREARGDRCEPWEGWHIEFERLASEEDNGTFAG